MAAKAGDTYEVLFDQGTFRCNLVRPVEGSEKQWEVKWQNGKQGILSLDSRGVTRVEASPEDASAGEGWGEGERQAPSRKRQRKAEKDQDAASTPPGDEVDDAIVRFRLWMQSEEGQKPLEVHTRARVLPWEREKPPNSKEMGLVFGEFLVAQEEAGNKVELSCKNDYVVAVLTAMRGPRADYKVASNQGTRPAICGAVNRVLGPDRWNDYPRSSAQQEFKAPELPEQEEISTEGGEEEAPVSTEEEMRQRISSNQSMATDDELRQKGLQLCRELLTPREVQIVIADLRRCQEVAKKPTTLARSRGNGENGDYVTIPNLKSLDHPILEIVRRAVAGWIEEKTGQDQNDLGTESLRLRYGEGGINFAHHDGSRGYQALLMLSRPGTDYNGGEFYVVDERNGHACKTTCPFENAGDLIVFNGDQNMYLHGMDTVLKGSQDETHRIAVGFFQPKA